MLKYWQMYRVISQRPFWHSCQNQLIVSSFTSPPPLPPPPLPPPLNTPPITTILTFRQCPLWSRSLREAAAFTQLPTSHLFYTFPCGLWKSVSHSWLLQHSLKVSRRRAARRSPAQAAVIHRQVRMQTTWIKRTCPQELIMSFNKRQRDKRY